MHTIRLLMTLISNAISKNVTPQTLLMHRAAGGDDWRSEQI